MECPKCKKEWLWNSEQAISVEWHDGCIGCRIHEMTKEEINLIALESQKRRTGQHLTPSTNLQE